MDWGAEEFGTGQKSKKFLDLFRAGSQKTNKNGAGNFTDNPSVAASPGDLPKSGGQPTRVVALVPRRACHCHSVGYGVDYVNVNLHCKLQRDDSGAGVYSGNALVKKVEVGGERLAFLNLHVRYKRSDRSPDGLLSLVCCCGRIHVLMSSSSELGNRLEAKGEVKIQILNDRPAARPTLPGREPSLGPCMKKHRSSQRL